MRRAPFPLSGRFPSATVPHGSFWRICVGRLVLLESPAPPVPSEAVASPWRRAPRGCQAPGLVGRQEPFCQRSQEFSALRLGLGNLVFPSGLFPRLTVRRSVAEMPYRTYQVQSVSIARHRLCRVRGVLRDERFEGGVAVPDDVAEVEMRRAGALLPPPPQRRQRNVEAFGRLLFGKIHGPLVHGSLQTI